MNIYSETHIVNLIVSLFIMIMCIEFLLQNQTLANKRVKKYHFVIWLMFFLITDLITIILALVYSGLNLFKEYNSIP